jgi:hypothetical protein
MLLESTSGIIFRSYPALLTLAFQWYYRFDRRIWYSTDCCAGAARSVSVQMLYLLDPAMPAPQVVSGVPPDCACESLRTARLLQRWRALQEAQKTAAALILHPSGHGSLTANLWMLVPMVR